ncbi:MAG: hemolysin family protein [Polyangiaceae bacterium]
MARSATRLYKRAPSGEQVAILVELLVIFVLILLNGVLAGSEIALVSIRKTRVDQLVQEKRAGAAAIKKLRKDPEAILATVQIGVTVITEAAAAVSGHSLSIQLEPYIRQLKIFGNSAGQVSLVLVVVSLAFLTLWLGELVPKSIALRSSERYGLLISRPLLGLTYVLKPAIWMLTWSSNLVLRFFGDKTNFSESRLSPGEIQQLVDEATEAGSVDPAAGEIASRAIDFADLTAAHVMVPRQKIIGIPKSASMPELRRIVLETGHTRMPVFDGVIDNVVGYVTLRDLITLLIEQQLLLLDDVLRPAFTVPESMRAVDLLQEMKQRKLQIAVVVDELGATSGIITLEDLVEELVGEISSEHDQDKPVPIVKEASGSALVRGDVPIREVNRELELELPEGETWTTVAGLCLHLAGRIPSVGDSFEAEDGSKLEVVSATPRSIKSVRVTPKPPEKGAEPE